MKQKFSVAAVMAFWFSTALGAGSATFTPFSVEGLSLSKTIKIDAAYGTRFGKTIAVPFSINVPITKQFDIFYDSKPDSPTDTTLLKITFATKDRQVIENIRFAPVQIGMGEVEVRIKTAAQVLAQKVFPDISRGNKDPKLLGVVQTRIDDKDAVVGVAQYTDPTFGPLFARLVLILNPKAPHSILAFATINPKLSAANQPDKLHKVGITYKLIESIRFLNR